MNKRQIKKFCKKGGHYHFDPTIRKISKKRMMYPYVTRGYYGHMITWHEVGTCLTCLHCTDVMTDWSGEPYACYSTTIKCGGCDNFSCKRYKLDNEIEFFKFAHIYSHSPESDAKRYIDKQIKEMYESSTDIPVETGSNSSSEDIENKVNERLKKWLDDYTVKEDLFNDKEILDYLDKQYDKQEAVSESKPEPITVEDFKEAQLAIENDLMNELIRTVEVDSEVFAIFTELCSTRPDVDINDRSIHYFVMYSDKADIFEIGEKYLIKVCDKTRCVICVEKNPSNEITFLNAIVLEDEDPCMCYEFSESDGDKFLCCGDLIVKENENE